MKKKKIITCCLLILAAAIFSLSLGKYIKNKNAHAQNSRVTIGSSTVQKKDNKSGKESKNVQDKKKGFQKDEKQSSKVKSTAQEKNDSNNKNTSAKAASSTTSASGSKAQDSGVTVYMRIEGYDKTFAPRTKVTTGIFDLNPYLGRATGSSATPSNGWGADKFKEPTVVHATVKLLEQNGYRHGTGYDLQDYGWSLYIAMIGGNREFDYRSTSGWMYRVNNVLPNIGSQAKPIKGGEEILWYFGAYGFDTLVTEMSANTHNINAGQSVTVTLNGIKNDIKTWKEYREPAKGATIYSNGSPLSINGKNIVTDSNGKAVIKFTKRGIYKLSAERVDSKGIKDIVRPIPVTINVK